MGPGIVPGGSLAVEHQVVRRDRLAGDLQKPAFPAVRRLGRLVWDEQVFPAQGAPSVLPGEQAHDGGIQRGKTKVKVKGQTPGYRWPAASICHAARGTRQHRQATAHPGTSRAQAETTAQAPGMRFCLHGDLCWPQGGRAKPRGKHDAPHH
jgi:hypothetical protein